MVLPLSSQSTIIDSLEQLLPSATISEKETIKYRIGQHLDTILDIKEKLQQTQQFQQAAEKVQDSLMLNEAYTRIGEIYTELGVSYNTNGAQNQQGKVTPIGWFFGVLMIQILYFLLLYIVEKDSIHLYFVLFVSGIFLQTYFTEGIMFSGISSEFRKEYHDVFILTGIFLFSTGLLKFTDTYFNYSKSRQKAKKIISIRLIVFTLLFIYLFSYQMDSNRSGAL